MIPVIISGGSGTRLWPVSRSSYPKQFCEFYDQSFLQNTLDRVTQLGASPLVVTVERMKDLTLRVLRDQGLGESHLICEPIGKNTAPAVALLCHLLHLRGQSNEVVGVFPADHLIADKERFLKVARFAEEVAENSGVVTIGIEPKYPATGFGYVEIQEDGYQLRDELSFYRVKRFCEKPDEKTAQEFIETKRHFWNTGIFIFRVADMIANFRLHMPELWNKILLIKEDLSNAKSIYANLLSQSLDYGIMEKLENQVHIPCDMLWSDVGSWDEMSRIANEMPNYKVETKAKVFSQNSSNNFIFSVKEKVLGLIGVQNLIIVDTPDALLIAQKGQSERVKNIVSDICEAGLPEGTDQPFEVRPWGRFEVLGDEKDYKVKKITVEPGGKLSYQSHMKRSEHWVVVSGEASIVIDENVNRLQAGQSIVAAQGTKHRIQNIGLVDLVLIEVQTGSYFGEDDITRYSDDYKRV